MLSALFVGGAYAVQPNLPAQPEQGNVQQPAMRDAQQQQQQQDVEINVQANGANEQQHGDAQPRQQAQVVNLDGLLDDISEDASDSESDIDENYIAQRSQEMVNLICNAYKHWNKQRIENTWKSYCDAEYNKVKGRNVVVEGVHLVTDSNSFNQLRDEFTIEYIMNLAAEGLKAACNKHDADKQARKAKKSLKTQLAAKTGGLFSQQAPQQAAAPAKDWL